MNTKHLFVILFLAMATPALTYAQKEKKKNETEKSATKLKSKLDSISYAIGVSIAQNLKSQGIDSVNPDMFRSALIDFKTQTLMTAEEANKFLNDYFNGIQSKKYDKTKIACANFLDENKKKPGVITLPDGLQYSIIKEGNGPMPKATDKVKTHYHGTLIDGKVFDSSVDRGEPVTFPVNGVIKGWTEALQMMKVGSKWKLFIPSDLAYGEQGAGGVIEPYSTLIFEVELLSIEQ